MIIATLQKFVGRKRFIGTIEVPINLPMGTRLELIRLNDSEFELVAVIPIIEREKNDRTRVLHTIEL